MSGPTFQAAPDVQQLIRDVARLERDLTELRDACYTMSQMVLAIANHVGIKGTVTVRRDPSAEAN